MRSCTTVLYLTAWIGLGAAVGAATAADPDRLYDAREDLTSARQAVEIWQARLGDDPTDFEAAWKIARATYWLGGHGPEDGRRADRETGIEAATRAIAIEPDRPEGHFWLAALRGQVAEASGRLTALRLRGPIKEGFETVLRLDPGFQHGSADRALGRWYARVPGLFGGSKEKSEEHLRRALAYNPQSTATLFFLAETLLARGREDEARATLQTLLAAPLDPDWAPEDREFKRQARELLNDL